MARKSNWMLAAAIVVSVAAAIGGGIWFLRRRRPDEGSSVMSGGVSDYRGVMLPDWGGGSVDATSASGRWAVLDKWYRQLGNPEHYAVGLGTPSTRAMLTETWAIQRDIVESYQPNYLDNAPVEYFEHGYPGTQEHLAWIGQQEPGYAETAKYQEWRKFVNAHLFKRLYEDAFRASGFGYIGDWEPAYN